MYTDPNNINSNLTKANTNNGSKIKPVIRLLKHWNISKELIDTMNHMGQKRN